MQGHTVRIELSLGGHSRGRSIPLGVSWSVDLKVAAVEVCTLVPSVTHQKTLSCGLASYALLTRERTIRELPFWYPLVAQTAVTDASSACS